MIPSDKKKPHNGRKYKIVRVTNVAYRTYRALLYYLHTGSISFAPLTSTYNVERANAAAETRTGDFPSRLIFCNENAVVASSTHFTAPDRDIQWTSAKSMYRLCDMLDISEVKTAAVQYIKDSLTPDNVIPEIFSVFASKYDEIYKAELDYVKTRWAEIRSSSHFKKSVGDLFSHGQDPLTTKTWLDIIEATST